MTQSLPARGEEKGKAMQKSQSIEEIYGRHADMVYIFCI